MTRSAIALVMVIAAAGCRTEASASASASADAKVRTAIETAAVPGMAYAVVTRERERFVAGSGVGDLELRTRVDAATVFEAASIAKLLVAVCVMQLVEDGEARSRRRCLEVRGIRDPASAWLDADHAPHAPRPSRFDP